jgi:hypothetical protein
MPDSNAQLDYAPAPPVLRRRWVRRLILGMVLLSALGAAVQWGPGAYRQASVLYWQRQCMRYTAPGEMVVYESDPNAGAVLQSADRHYQLAAAGSWGRSATRTATGYLPECWNRFSRVAPGFLPPTAPVVFLHELRTPSGQRRLVSVVATFEPSELPLFISGYDVSATVIAPATWRMLPRNRTGGVALSVLSGPQPKPPHVRVYAGQPDPADPSHFTIRYEVDGVEHVADGWLRDGWPAGYDSVQFKVRG